MDSPIIDLLIVTMVVVGVYGLSRGRAFGYFIACAIWVTVLTILQCAWNEIGTYAGLAYLFLWSIIYICWTSIVWAICAGIRWGARTLRRRT